MHILTNCHILYLIAILVTWLEVLHLGCSCNFHFQQFCFLSVSVQHLFGCSTCKCTRDNNAVFQHILTKLQCNPPTRSLPETPVPSSWNALEDALTPTELALETLASGILESTWAHQCPPELSLARPVLMFLQRVLEGTTG